MQVLTKAFSTVLIAFFFVRCNGSLIEKATAPTTDRELAPLKLSICDAVDNLCKTLGENHSHCKLTRNAEYAASCSAPLAKAVTKPEKSENGIDVGETGRDQQLSSFGAGPYYTTSHGTAGAGKVCIGPCFDVGKPRKDRGQFYDGVPLPHGWCHTDSHNKTWGGCGGCPPGKHGYPSCQNNCHATCLTCASQSKTYCTSCKLDRKLMRIYQAFPALPTGALATGLGRAGTSGGYFSQAETVGFCEHIDTATDAPFCYPPKDVVYTFSASGKEMSLVCTKGNVVKFTHQVFWWYFVPSMGQKAQESVIAAAGGIATPSNWRRIIALAHCRVVKLMKCFVSNAHGVQDHCFVTKSGSCKQVSWLLAPTGHPHCPNCYCKEHGMAPNNGYAVNACQPACKEHVDTHCSAVKAFSVPVGADYWCKEGISNF